MQVVIIIIIIITISRTGPSSDVGDHDASHPPPLPGLRGDGEQLILGVTVAGDVRYQGDGVQGQGGLGGLAPHTFPSHGSGGQCVAPHT